MHKNRIKTALQKGNKVDNKNTNILCHKFVVLYELMMSTLDELESTSIVKEANVKCLGPSLKFCETVLDEFIPIPNLKSTMYIQSIAKKVDTVMRKSYEPQ